MTLVDTSIWVDHLRKTDSALAALLNSGQVLGHPFVRGEVALGSLKQRQTIIDALAHLPQAVVATDLEVMAFIDAKALFGRGIGYVDAHLLASAALTPGARLWTRDKRLRETATRLALSER